MQRYSALDGNFSDTLPSQPAPLASSRTSRPTPLQHAATRAVCDRNARVTRRAEAAANFVVALVLAIALAVLLVHWLTPCDAGYLCSLAPAALTSSRRVRAGGAPPPPMPAAWPTMQSALDAAHEEGEREGYVAGWRYGWACGLTFGVLIGSSLVAASLWWGSVS